MMVNPMKRRIEIIRLAVRLYRIAKEIGKRKTKGLNEAETRRLYAFAGQLTRETAERLCGGIVKIGQFLSLRQELFPSAFTKELEGLQDKVPPSPFREIRDVIEAELGRPLTDIFREFDEREVASASLAQVYRAKLMDHETVAVKVLRPGIERLVNIDLSTLRTVANVLNRIPALRRRMDFTALYEAFATTLTRELDMQAEIQHMQRFEETFGQDKRVLIPKVFPMYSTKRVLVMTHVDGARVTDALQLKAWHVDGAMIRDTFVDIFVQQLLQGGFVHLDPHPGNLLVLPDSRLALLDFGMVGEFDQSEVVLFRNLLQRVVLGDVRGVVGTLRELGYVPSEADVDVIATRLDGMQGHFDISALANLLREEHVVLQGKYMLLMRCLLLLKSVLEILTPNETDWLGVLSECALPILMQSKNTVRLVHRASV